VVSGEPVVGSGAAGAAPQAAPGGELLLPALLSLW
jgi:hypothetical protein